MPVAHTNRLWRSAIVLYVYCFQYAHKLAYLIGENVRRDPSEELADRLYYL